MGKENIHHRVCSLIQILAGNEVHGLRNSEIADALNVSRPTVSRDLSQLADAGVAELIPGLKERWRLGPKMIQISRAHAEGMARIKSQIAEIDQRYTRQF